MRRVQDEGDVLDDVVDTIVDGAVVTPAVMELVRAAEVSKCMHLLEEASVVENVGGEGLLYECWSPTPYGERVVLLIKQQEKELEEKGSV